MEALTMALFGEAEKGEYNIPYLCQSLPQLIEYLGSPPPESHGLYYAIQALLYHRKILFFRVQEEGFSLHDYQKGIKILQDHLVYPKLAAICVPGLGDSQTIQIIINLCFLKNSVLITTEADLYDYLTA